MEGDFFVGVVKNLSPEFIYVAAGSLAYWVAGALTVPLLFFSLVKRTGGEVFTSLSGNKISWTQVSAAFLGWTIFLTVYFACCQLIFDSFNVLYEFSNRLGGNSGMMSKFQQYYDKALTHTDDHSTIEKIKNVASLPVTGATLILYQISLLIYLAADIFVRWVQAIGFATAFYWGLIAIPYSLNSEEDAKFIKNWKVMFTVSLLWPVIHGFTQWLISQGFVSMFDRMATWFGQGNNPMLDLASVYSTFTLLHIVLILGTGISCVLVMAMVATGSVAAMNNFAMGGAMGVGAAGYGLIKKGLGVASGQTLSAAGNTVGAALQTGKGVVGRSAAAFKRDKSPNNLSQGYSFAKNRPRVEGQGRHQNSKTNTQQSHKTTSREDHKTVNQTSSTTSNTKTDTGATTENPKPNSTDSSTGNANGNDASTNPRRKLTHKQEKDRKNALIRNAINKAKTKQRETNEQ